MQRLSDNSVPANDPIHKLAATPVKSRFFLFYLAVGLTLLGLQLVWILEGPNGQIGADYGYYLPRIIEGKLFFRAQGIRIPWYSVLFCGGVPYFGNPASFFYSVPQFLGFIVNPWIAVQLTTFLFLLIGGVSFYYFLSSCFQYSSHASVAGALCFATNGFFASRMLVGHLSFHCFMLLPLIATLLASTRISSWRAILITSILGAYFCSSGGHIIITLAPFAIMMMLSLCFLFGKIDDLVSFRILALRVVLSTLLSLMVSLSQLVAIHSTMSVTFRTVALTKMESPVSALLLSLSQLFFLGEYWPYAYTMHEGDASIPPLLIFGIITAIFFGTQFLFVFKGRKELFRIVTAAFCFIVTGWAVVAMVYGQGSTVNLLQHIPGFAHIRSNLRFSATFIFPAIIIGVFGFDRMQWIGRNASLCLLSASCLLVNAKLMVHRDFYFDFSTKEIPALYRHYSDTPLHELVVKGIDHPRPPSYSNDLQAVARSLSSYSCYEPILGDAPPLQIVPGTLTSRADGKFNLSKAVCYSYPEENDCRPGDLIPEQESTAFQALIEHTNPDWPMAPRQIWANRVSLISLIFNLGSVLLLGLCSIAKRFLRYL